MRLHVIKKQLIYYKKYRFTIDDYIIVLLFFSTYKETIPLEKLISFFSIHFM